MHIFSANNFLVNSLNQTKYALPAMQPDITSLYFKLSKYAVYRFELQIVQKKNYSVN